jgi:L-alanine-DL-glutamate epimerase-like enolase superfamily enzyme
VAKLKGGLDVSHDLTRLTLVRDVLAEATPRSRPGLMLDANESWTRKQAVRHVAELERTLDLLWVEEPVRRWDADGMVVVGRAVRASIAAGENLTGLEQFRPLLSAGAVDIVQTASVWGVTHFLRVATLAHAHDLPVSPIGTTPIGLVHAATAVPNHIVSELQDLTPPTGLSVDHCVEDGRFVLGDGPGLGVSVDEEAIALIQAPDSVPSRTGPHIRPTNAGRRLDVDPPR